MTRPTLLQSQTNALFTLLNLNQPVPSSSTSGASTFPGAATASTFEEGAQGPLVWKVLILDDASKDILATSLRVQDLREQGVTLHMCVFPWLDSQVDRSLGLKRAAGATADHRTGNYIHSGRPWQMSLLYTLYRPR
jgi:hypothetical protein